MVVTILEPETLFTVDNSNLHILLLGSDTFELDVLFKNKFNPPEYCPTRESTYPFEAASLPNMGSGICGGVLNITCPLTSIVVSVLILYAFILPLTDMLYIDALFAVILFTDALRADKLSIDALFADTLLAVILFTDALRADKLSIDVLNMDTLLAVILLVDMLIVDKLVMDTLLAVILSVDMLSVDKLNMDALFAEILVAVILFIDALFADKLVMDTLSIEALFADKLVIDALFADKLVMDALSINALLADKLLVDKFVNVFVMAVKFIAIPDTFVVMFCPPKLNIFTFDPVSIFVVPVRAVFVKM